MGATNDCEVVIGGKVITLSGAESEEYLQKVATYINNKIAEYDSLEDYRHLPLNMKSTLIQLNIADDFFKAKAQVDVAHVKRVSQEVIAGTEIELVDKLDLLGACAGRISEIADLRLEAVADGKDAQGRLRGKQDFHRGAGGGLSLPRQLREADGQCKRCRWDEGICNALRGSG